MRVFVRIMTARTLTTQFNDVYVGSSFEVTEIPLTTDPLSALPPELAESVKPFIYNGNVWVFVTPAGQDQPIVAPLVSARAVKAMASIVAPMAVVNYRQSIDPYIPALVFMAEACTIEVPRGRFVCIRGQVYAVSTDADLVTRIKKEQGPPIMGLEISKFIAAPLHLLLTLPINQAMMRPFDDPRDYLHFLWLLGDAALEPPTQARLVMLYGDGSNGKSKLLEFAAKCFGNESSAPLPDGSLCVNPRQSGLSDALLEAMCVHKFVYEGDMELNVWHMCPHTVKLCTGGDSLSVHGVTCRGTATIMCAINSLSFYEGLTPASLPGIGEPWWVRRVRVLPTNTQFNGSVDVAPEPTALARAEFMSTAIAVRSSYPCAPPLTLQGLLYTLFGAAGGTAYNNQIREGDESTSYEECLAGTIRLAVIMKASTDVIMENVRSISPGNALQGFAGPVISRIVCA